MEYFFKDNGLTIVLLFLFSIFIFLAFFVLRIVWRNILFYSLKLLSPWPRVSESLSIHLWQLQMAIQMNIFNFRSILPAVRQFPTSKDIYLFFRQLLPKFINWWKTERHQLFASKNDHVPLDSGLKKWQPHIEIGIIIIMVATYCRDLLNLNPQAVLPGNEAEIFQTLDWIFTSTFQQTGHFPVWNPYFYSGLPLIGDPMFHFFNPLVSLPILFFGVSSGFKIAIFVSFIAGAVGMWFMGLAFGMKPIARIWMAWIFAFAGQPAARFFQGQYLFIFAWAFIPWIIGGLYSVYRTRRRVYVVITAVALAEIFLSGNAYYGFFTVIIIAVFLLVFLVTPSTKTPFLHINFKSSLMFILIGVIAIGLTSIQILPTMQLWPRVFKSEDMTGSQNLSQVMMDFLSNDSSRPDMYSIFPAREEFYAYIGITPFLFSLLLPLALIKRHKRPILFAFLMLVVSFLWIDVKDMPWADVYRSIHLIAQFRHQIRMIIYFEVGLLILLGYALDTIWRILWNGVTSRPLPTNLKNVPTFSILGCGLLLGLAGYSIFNLYSTNRPIISTTQANLFPYQLTSWLNDFDKSIFFTRYSPNNTAFNANIVNHMRLIEIWYHFNDVRDVNDGRTEGVVQASPNYFILESKDTPPINTEIVKTISNYTIYHSLDALPFSFAVKNNTLSELNGGELKLQDVTPLTAFSPHGDFLEVIANGNHDSTLAILVTKFPGWIARIDGSPVEMQSINGYLALPMRDGVHKYTFSFESGVLTAGIIISLFTLLFLLWWVAGYYWAATWTRLKSLTQPGTFKWKELIQNNPMAVFYRHVIDWRTLDFNFLGLRFHITKGNVNSEKMAVLSAEILFVASLFVYTTIHFVSLEQYPIAFTTGEAALAINAKDLVNNNFTDSSGHFLPINFDPSRWSPSFPIYVQAIGLLFGDSVLAVRGTVVAISILAAIALALILRYTFKARFWWVGVLNLGIIPAWFILSRTAAEPVIISTCFAVFLLFYLLYLTESPRFIFPAILFACFTFYSSLNGQFIIGVSCLLLLISDIRYHLRHRLNSLWALIFCAVGLYPRIQYAIAHSNGQFGNFTTENSYLFTKMPLLEKIWTFIQNYSYSISPQYWFFPNQQNIARLNIEGYSHIWLVMYPLFLLGFVIFIRNFSSPKYRAVILLMLAIPISSSFVNVEINQVISFVIPATILISIGFDWLLSLIARRYISRIIPVVLFGVMASCSFILLQPVIAKGPTMQVNYGISGMQWGATQIFKGVVPKYLLMDPSYQLHVSSTWADGTDRFFYFFLSKDDQQRVNLDSLDLYSSKKLDLDWNNVFISTLQEYKVAKESNKFEKLLVREIVPYPNGSPGFYVLQAAYRSDVDSLFAAEKEARKKLTEGNFVLNGQNLIVRNSIIDMGTIADLFDNDLNTLIRGLEANPFILEIEFPQPQPIQSISLQTNSMNMQITAKFFGPDGQNLKEIVKYIQYDDSIPGNTANILSDGGPILTKRIRLEIMPTDIPQDIEAHVHVRELHWR